MGRGRAKAKQAKVARQLKYAGASTDLDALRRELVSDSSRGGVDLDDEFDDDTDEFDDDADDDTDDEDSPA